MDTSRPNMKDRTPKKKNVRNDFWDMIRFAIIALVIVIPVRMFIAQPFIVSGASMVPTFENGDYLIIDEISYRLNDPQRGDVIVFRYPEKPDTFFIKRIIGLPGETISIRDNTIRITTPDATEPFILDEEYLNDVNTSGSTHITLNEEEYFVMGDNRAESSDSRAWGPLGEDFIIGRAWVRLFPFKHISYMPGHHTFEALPTEEKGEEN